MSRCCAKRPYVATNGRRKRRATDGRAIDATVAALEGEYCDESGWGFANGAAMRHMNATQASHARHSCAVGTADSRKSFTWSSCKNVIRAQAAAASFESTASIAFPYCADLQFRTTWSKYLCVLAIFLRRRHYMAINEQKLHELLGRGLSILARRSMPR